MNPNSDKKHLNTLHQNGPFLPGLTILRGLAACWVVLHNDALFRNHFRLDDQTDFVLRGYLAVDVFLFLSGFVLTVRYAPSMFASFNSQVYLEFIGRRLARIYPLFIFLLMIRAGLETARIFIGRTDIFVGSTSLDALLGNIFLVQAWGFWDEWTWVPAAWTVSAEWFCYLLFPLLLWIARPMWSWLLAAVTAVICIGTLAGYCFHFGGMEFPMQASLLRCLPEFIIGMILGAFWLRWKPVIDLRQKWFAIGFGLLVLLGAHWGWHDLVLLCFALVLVVASAGQSMKPVSSWQSEQDPNLRQPSQPFWYRWLLHLGTISYAIYLSHQLVQSVWIRIHAWHFKEASSLGWLCLWAAQVAMIWLCSHILYRMIESPARNWLRSKLSGNSPRIGPETARAS
ncbi:MAG: acyltransferase [Planctomycetota bacterium]